MSKKPLWSFFEIMRRPLQARTAGIYIFLERGRDRSLMRNLAWLATSLMNCKEYVENKNFIKINFLFHHFLSFSGQHQSFFFRILIISSISLTWHTHTRDDPTNFPTQKSFHTFNFEPNLENQLPRNKFFHCRVLEVRSCTSKRTSALAAVWKKLRVDTLCRHTL